MPDREVGYAVRRRRKLIAEDIAFFLIVLFCLFVVGWAFGEADRVFEHNSRLSESRAIKINLLNRVYGFEEYLTETAKEHDLTPACFTTASEFCDFAPGGAVETVASALFSDTMDDAEKAALAVEWVAEHIVYDSEKASELSEAGEKEYIPDPDSAVVAGKGVCSDQAAVVAALMRSQGIPARIVVGWVGYSVEYHAWNEIWHDNEWHKVFLPLDDSHEVIEDLEVHKIDDYR